MEDGPDTGYASQFPRDEDHWTHEMSEPPTEEDEHFHERYKDLFLDRIISMGEGQYQVEGRNTDGERVWIQVWIKNPVSFEIWQPPTPAA